MFGDTFCIRRSFVRIHTATIIFALLSGKNVEKVKPTLKDIQDAFLDLPGWVLQLGKLLRFSTMQGPTIMWPLKRINGKIKSQNMVKKNENYIYPPTKLYSQRRSDRL